jgi:hypothetical protein
VEAAESGLISFYAAAEEANLITRAPTLGTGSMNVTRTRMWAMAKVTGQNPLLASGAKDQPEPQPKPQPLLPEIRAILDKLVSRGRSDLIAAVAEQRMDPYQAEAVADQDERRRALPEKKPKPVKKSEPKKPEPEKAPPLRYDVKAMIA